MITATVGQELLTAADLLRLHRKGVKGELVRGVLHELMSTSGEHSEVAAALAGAIWAHVRPRRLGRVSSSDGGVLLERDPDTVREMDVGYFSAETLPLDERVRHSYYEVIPDLVAEIVSPSDRPREVAERDRDVAQLRRGNGLGGLSGAANGGGAPAGRRGGYTGGG